MKLGAKLLTQHVDGDGAALNIYMPERPAVTRGQILHMGTDFMDGAFKV